MEKSEEIKALMQQLYEAMGRGDVEGFENHVSRSGGTLVIGTDPKEWWSGYEEIHRVFSQQIKEMGGTVEIVASELHAYSEGSVGWTADKATFRLSDGTQMPFRATGVLHREGSDWKLVQWHVSFGVANEEVLGKELTV
jgi:ketosteroid isomerase-like protein